MSEFFSNAHNFSINGGTFSGVNGDQHNHYYKRTVQASHLSTSRSGLIAQGTSSRAITTTIHINGNQINNQIVEREEKELTEFDDYRNLKRGDICRLRNICQVRCDEDCHCGSCRQWKQGVMKMICAAKVNGVEGEFTVVSYTGPDARKVFEEEFHKLSRQLFSEAAQVYAIDKGTIPSMVLWHNLVPLVQLLSNVGVLVQKYLKNLSIQWDCDHEEMWLDPTRGVVCRGPKGPPLYIFVDELEIKGLPPTAELLQEEVLVRFLACQKSREADDAFMYVMSFDQNGENVPEQVDRPTILSALTKTPIAVANNIWKDLEDNLVERTCLENGSTRFRLDGRLDGDDRLWLWLNGDIEKAWHSQASSVFHARGVSLEDDLKNLYLVYPCGWLRGYVDDSPSKRQLQRQQPIFLFIHPPPPNLPNGETSPLHHWSFQEDGHSHISLESCFHLGLPVKLHYHNGGHNSYFWPTDRYKLIHQYQIARGFDPTTANFARHLGYDNIFQPLDDADRFEDVQKDQTPLPPNTSADHDGSLHIVDSEYSSDIPDPIRAEDVVYVSDPQNTRDECYKSSYHNIPNKRRKTDFDCGGIENRNYPHQDLYHKVDLTSDEKVMTDADWQPIRPLPARNLPFAGTNPTRYVQQNTSASQLYSLHYSSSDNQVSRRHPSLSSRDVLSPYDLTASTASISDQSSLPTHTVEHPLNMSHTTQFNSFDMSPPFGSYIQYNDTYSVTDPVANRINSPYSDPSAYSVTTIPTEYDSNPVQSLGWSDNPPLNVFNDNTSNHSSGFNPYPPTLTIPYPTHSIDHTHPPYHSYGNVSPPVGYSSTSSSGGSLGPQHGWNGSTIHSQQHKIPSHSWGGPVSTPSYGQPEYEGSSEGGRNSDGEGWF
ncbi:hypothetical protein PQX77_013927 [Marasmius sp. AFHP31]|nr:hypothetical protein PQX77_013927 [Marasmius sp. AFHP31]